MKTVDDWIRENRTKKKLRMPPAKNHYNIHPSKFLQELHINAVVAANYDQPSTRYYPGTGYKM